MMEAVWALAGGVMVVASLWLPRIWPGAASIQANTAAATVSSDDNIYPVYREMGIAPVSDESRMKYQDIVVLVHGIARTGLSLRPLEQCLRRAGYQVVNVTYLSRSRSVNDTAAFLRRYTLDSKFWDRAARVHFVTHSMGGLVVHRYLDNNRDRIPAHKVGRVVMLAPPSGGSEIADLLHRWWPYRWYFGPAGQDLTTSARSRDVTRPYYELGVIAGNRGWLYLAAMLVVNGPHDGRVSVERTKFPGMKDHFTLPATHTFIMNKAATQRQVIHFLTTGNFQHDAS